MPRADPTLRRGGRNRGTTAYPYARPTPSPSSSSSSLLSSSPPRYSLSDPFLPPYTQVPVSLPPDSPRRGEEAWKFQLKTAATMLSYMDMPVPRLIEVPYPCDAADVPVPVKSLVDYARKHHWLENVYCFCSRRTNTNLPVRIFVPRTGEHEGMPCIGCVNWKGNFRGGCGFFKNIKLLVKNHPNQPIQAYPVKKVEDVTRSKTAPVDHKGTVRNERFISAPPMSNGDMHPTTLAAMGFPNVAMPVEDAFEGYAGDIASTTTLSSPSSSQNFATNLIKQEDVVGKNALREMSPYTPISEIIRIGRKNWIEMPNIEPGYIDDFMRLWHPAPVGMVIRRIHEVMMPTREEALDIVMRLFSPQGVGFHDLFAVLGRCLHCDQLVATSYNADHVCAVTSKSASIPQNVTQAQPQAMVHSVIDLTSDDE